MTRHQRFRAGILAFASAIAVIAATVSYQHIFNLARVNGGSVLAAALLPLSVDALVVVGELMLLHEADSKGERFPLGWAITCSGILATLAANAAYGWQANRWEGMLVWAWPGYALTLAASGVIVIVRRAEARGIPEPGTLPEHPARPASTPAPGTLPRAPLPAAAGIPASTPPQAGIPEPGTLPGSAGTPALPDPLGIPGPADTPEPGTLPEPTGTPARAPLLGPPASLNGHGHAAAELFAADLAAGQVPGIARIRKEMRVGATRAQDIRAYLRELAGTLPGHTRPLRVVGEREG